MRRLLQDGLSTTEMNEKREEIPFSEEGWARTSNSRPMGYFDAYASELRYPNSKPPNVSKKYQDANFLEGAEGDYVDEDPDVPLNYSHYYRTDNGSSTESYQEEARLAGIANEEAEKYGHVEEEATNLDGYAYAYDNGANDDDTEYDNQDSYDYGNEYISYNKSGLEEDNGEVMAAPEQQEEDLEKSNVPDTTTIQAYTMKRIAKRVEVRYTEEKGRCLHARSEMDPGDVIFVEEPVLVAVPSLNEELWNLLTILNDQSAFDLPPIWHLAALCSLTMLEEEGINICLDKWVPESDSEPSNDVLRVLEYIDTQIDPMLYERMLLVWRYNSFGHHSEHQGLVLYNRISMMAHSCQATACWYYSDNHVFVLRARVKLNAGDEITISYIGDDELIKPTNVRREKVQGWLFTCQCIRCIAPVDTARGFRCPTCGTGCMFFKTENEVTSSTPCTTCHAVPSESTITTYVEYEQAYEERLPQTNTSDMADAEMVYEQATRVFIQHWILFQLDNILFEGYRASGDYESAYFHQNSRLQYLTKVFPLSSFALAWLYEEMGDVIYTKMQAKGKPYTASALRIASRHFEDAYNLLFILCGAEHEYTTSALTKRNKIEEVIQK